jgi:hypothetical protein
VLWLTGFLSVGQGNLTTQWAAPHCPSGPAQSGQQSHNHCAWHCGGLDIQGGDGRGESSIDHQVSRIWSLGVILRQEAVPDSEFPPRGPPHVAFEIA